MRCDVICFFGFLHFCGYHDNRPRRMSKLEERVIADALGSVETQAAEEPPRGYVLRSVHYNRVDVIVIITVSFILGAHLHFYFLFLIKIKSLEFYEGPLYFW